MFRCNFLNEFRTYFVQYFEKMPKEEYQKRISRSIEQAIGRKGYIEYCETNKFLSLMKNYIREAILKKCKNEKIVNEIFNWINEVMKKDTLEYYLDGIEELLDRYFTKESFQEERLKSERKI